MEEDWGIGMGDLMLSFENISSLIRYEKETGKLFWKSRSADMFRSAHHSAETACKIWNARYAGNEAFTASDEKGYKKGSVFDVDLRPYVAKAPTFCELQTFANGSLPTWEHYHEPLIIATRSTDFSRSAPTFTTKPSAFGTV